MLVYICDVVGYPIIKKLRVIVLYVIFNSYIVAIGFIGVGNHRPAANH